MPLVCFLVPYAFLNCLAKLDIWQNPKLGGSILQVFENLWLTRIGTGPCWVLEEAETVKMAGYIAGTPGVSVLSPSSSKRCRLLQDSVPGEEIYTHACLHCTLPDSQLMEAFSHANTRDASTQHYHMEVCGRRGSKWRWSAAKEEEDAEADEEERGGCPTLEEEDEG